MRFVQPALWRYLITVSGIAAGYLVITDLTRLIPTVHLTVSAIWPAAGFNLAVLLLGGYPMGIGITIGECLHQLSLHMPWFYASASAANATLEAIVAVLLLKAIRFCLSLRRLRDILGLVTLAGLVATLLGAFLGAVLLCLSGIERWSQLKQLLWVRWLGDSIGILVITPVLLVGGEWIQTYRSQGKPHQTQDFFSSRPSQWAELTLCLTLLTTTSWLVFIDSAHPTIVAYPIEYIPFLTVVWSALRLGQETTMLANLLVSAIAIGGTVQGMGPFGSLIAELGNQVVLILQAFLGVTTLITLTLSTAVAERRRSQAALLESEQRFRAIFEQTYQLIAVLQPDGALLEINQAALQFMDVPSETAVGMPFWQTAWWAGSAKAQAEVEVAVAQAATGQFIQYEVDLPRADGSITTLDFSLKPVKNSIGQVVLLVAEGWDISSRKRREDALQTAAKAALYRREAQLQRIAANLPGVIYQFLLYPNGQQAFPYLSERIYDICEIDSQDILQDARLLLNLIHPDDVEAFETSVAISAETLSTWSWEGRIVTRSGQQRWVQGISQPERLLDGTILWDGVLLDSTDRKRVEQDLNRTQALREAIFNESADAIFLVDTTTLLTLDCNQRAVEMFESDSKAEFIGIEGQTLQRSQFSLEELTSIVEEINVQGYWSREIEYVTRRGRIFWGNIAAKAIQVVDQRMNLVRVTDISDRKQAEEQLQALMHQLQQQNQQLAEISRLKSEFLANVSHELRTPLTSVLGLSGVLLQQHFGPINDKQRQYLSLIQSSGQHLLSLINDLLDLAKVEAGKLEIYKEPVSLALLCQEALQMMEVRAAAKHQNLVLELPIACDSIVVDRLRILQVLLNYLSNAVKFTPDNGKITLSTQLASRLEMETHCLPVEAANQFCSEFCLAATFLVLSVSDTGAGIAPEQQHLLFQTFQQVNGAINRHHEGTGLGLALTKRLVELHCGAVSFTSTLGVGSTFCAWLPYCP